MRDSGMRGPLIYCTDFHCSYSTAISTDPWPDQVRLSDLEPRFVCQACGRRGADFGRTSTGIRRLRLSLVPWSVVMVANAMAWHRDV
jgi:hypothetical protein